MEEQQAHAWLSEPRYARFLGAADGDHERAMALYEWHVNLSAASSGLIHRFEVLLRNSVDGVLGEGQPQTPIRDTWLLDFETLQPDGIKQVIVAIERIEKPDPLRKRGGVWFAVGDRQLHIGVEKDFGAAHKAHPAFALPPADLDLLAARLADSGADVAWDSSLPGQRRFYCQDPWGNRIEFLADRL